MEDIEKRLAAIEARIAISELRSKYCWYTARGLQQDVVALFTDDGVFQNARADAAKPVVVTGTQALRDYFSRMKPARRIPLVTNEVTVIEGDAAEGTCAMYGVGEEGFCGHYVDTFAKVDGQWRFRARRFYPYWPTFHPDPDRRHP
ncbi:MAG TPA: nuclear transport factor 2 family protein [Ramlibacter sp.]|nr:nuclear transport factor 2 family protein [Ramlibacter sp.]